jgi:flagellar basal-body rod protein FlgC
MTMADGPMSIFDISGRAMSAQLVRLNTTASNLANIEPTRRHDPNHPLADANGDVWVAGVDSAAEMIEMVEAARQYQNNVQVLQTAKTLMLDTLRMGS